MHPTTMLKRTLATSTLAASLVAAAATPARAIPYEAFIDIETEDDLDDLLASGQIEVDTHEALRVLLDRGVVLDTATREELYSLPNLTYADVDAILEYRKLNGFIADPIDLVVAGALTEEKLLAISSFLVVGRRAPSKYEPHGFVRVFTRGTQADRTVPPVGARVRVEVPVHFVNHEAAPGLKRGGALNIVAHSIELNVLAESIPEYLTADLTGLDINDSVHLSQIKLPEGARPTSGEKDFTEIGRASCRERV